MRRGLLTKSASVGWFLLALLAPPEALPHARALAYTGQDAIQEELEQKLNSGKARALAPAQARYREALAALAAGDGAEAVRLLDAAAAFDPTFPDPHYTLARVLAFQDPGRAVAEFSEALRIVGRSYSWQRYVLANSLTAFLVIWSMSLLFAVVGVVLRHLPHLTHVIRELVGRAGGATARGAAGVIALAPLLWGLGPISTATVYAGLLSFRLGRREAFLVFLFLVSSLAIVGGMRVIAPWAGGISLEEPSLLVDRALRSGANPDLMAALAALEGHDSAEPLYPFALGTMARREGDFDQAERQLTIAAALKPNTSWILTNLGNVHFGREDYPRAREAYEAAAKASPRAVEPHYNLAQTYTKQLLFAEASREQSIASGLAFDRVRDMSRISTPQLNRTVMEAVPPIETLWGLARRTAQERGAAETPGNPYFSFLGRLAPPAPFALFFIPAVFLVFAACGQAFGRTLGTLSCSNCQKVVCRRCVHRMQQRAFCDDCFAAVKDLKSMEFTRLLLTGRDRRAARRRTFWETLVTYALPGAGQMLRGASLSGFFAILVMVTAALLVISNGALVPSLDVLPLVSAGWVKRIPLAALFAATYAITVARYYAKTTTKVPNLAQGLGRVPARTPRARVEGGTR